MRYSAIGGLFTNLSRPQHSSQLHRGIIGVKRSVAARLITVHYIAEVLHHHEYCTTPSLISTSLGDFLEY